MIKGNSCHKELMAAVTMIAVAVAVAVVVMVVYYSGFIIFLC